MKTYTITIPSFTLRIEAESKKQALEQFWFDYDSAADDPDWQKPIIKLSTKNNG